RHIVPVDRQARTREVRRTGEADAAAGWELAKFRRPGGRLDDAADALGEADGADAQIIRGERVRLFDDAQAQFRRVELQLLCNLVELNFLAEPALRRAVSAFRAA